MNRYPPHMKAAAHPALTDLKAAKEHSDNKRYAAKSRLLGLLMRRDPDAFDIDSDDGKGIVGITHNPTGFRIHMQKSHVGPDVLLRHSRMSKAATAAKIRKMFQPLLSQKPLFGEAVARRARKGVNIHHTGASDSGSLAFSLPKLGGKVERLLGFLRHPSVNPMGHNTKWQQIHRKPGVHLDFTGRGSSGRAAKQDFVGRGNDAHLRISDSKLYEAQQLPGLLPRTENLGGLLKRLRIDPKDDAAIQAGLKREYGKFILKPDGGYAVPGSVLPTDKSSVGKIRAMLDDGITNNQGAHFRGGVDNFVVQQRVQAKPLSRPNRATNNFLEAAMQGKLGHLKGIVSGDPRKRKRAAQLLRALGGGKLPFKALGSVTGAVNQEFRVHVVNGKVIPYATLGRGSVLGEMPIRTPGMGKVESYVGQQLRGVDPTKLKGTWGMDVVKTKDGGFKIIETNPTTGVGGSGFAEVPHIQDAMAGALQGRLPRYILAQRAGVGASGAAAVTAAGT